MRSLWFKQAYVQPILDGTKRVTVRRLNKQNDKLVVGERVGMSVGARAAFATAHLSKIERLAWSDLGTEKQRELEGLGIDDDGSTFLRITFDDVQSVEVSRG